MPELIEPSCMWAVVDPQRANGVLLAGFFRLGDAVREAIRICNFTSVRSTVYRQPWIAVEPWFESHTKEFEFWGQWWAWQDRR